MPKFFIELTEVTYSGTDVTVEAESKDKAISEVWEMIHAGEIEFFDVYDCEIEIYKVTEVKDERD